MAFKHGLFHSLRTLATGGLTAQALSLLGAVLITYLLLAPLAFFLNGSEGLIAAAVAAGICTFGSIGALAAMQVLKGPSLMFAGVVLGMFLRMTVPLVFCFVVYSQPGLLTRTGMVFYILAFYMVTLTIDALITALRVGDSFESGESLMNRNVQSHG